MKLLRSKRQVRAQMNDADVNMMVGSERRGHSQLDDDNGVQLKANAST